MRRLPETPDSHRHAASDLAPRTRRSIVDVPPEAVPSGLADLRRLSEPFLAATPPAAISSRVDLDRLVGSSRGARITLAPLDGMVWSALPDENAPLWSPSLPPPPPPSAPAAPGEARDSIDADPAFARTTMRPIAASILPPAPRPARSPIPFFAGVAVACFSALFALRVSRGAPSAAAAEPLAGGVVTTLDPVDVYGEVSAPAFVNTLETITITGDGAPRAFDPAEASAELDQRLDAARACRREGEAGGLVKVGVVFAPDGSGSRATVSGELAGTRLASCVARAFSDIKVSPFSGSPVTLRRKFPLR